MQRHGNLEVGTTWGLDAGGPADAAGGDRILRRRSGGTLDTLAATINEDTVTLEDVYGALSDAAGAFLTRTPPGALRYP